MGSFGKVSGRDGEKDGDRNASESAPRVPMVYGLGLGQR